MSKLKICPFCNKPNCNITKDEMLKRGPILEPNAYAIMRTTDYEGLNTYAFKGIPTFNSFSALIPDEDDENPHAYIRLRYDEDKDCSQDFTCYEVANPLSFPTESEMITKIKN